MIVGFHKYFLDRIETYCENCFAEEKNTKIMGDYFKESMEKIERHYRPFGE